LELVLATFSHWQHFPLPSRARDETRIPLRRAAEDNLFRSKGFMGFSFRSFRFDLCAAMDADDIAFGNGAKACAVLFVKRIAARYCNSLSAFRAKQIVICRPLKNGCHRANDDKQCHGNCGTKRTPIQILQQANPAMASTMKTIPNLQYSLNFLKADFISRLLLLTEESCRA